MWVGLLAGRVSGSDVGRRHAAKAAAFTLHSRVCPISAPPQGQTRLLRALLAAAASQLLAALDEARHAGSSGGTRTSYGSSTSGQPGACDRQLRAPLMQEQQQEQRGHQQHQHREREGSAEAEVLAEAEAALQAAREVGSLVPKYLV